MNVGNFWFKNDEVVLLAGKPKEISALADKLVELREQNIEKFHINELARQSNNHPADLYAVKSVSGSINAGVFYWPCLESIFHLGAVRKLREIAEKESEASFKLEKSSTSILIVACDGHYDETWWNKNG